MMNTDSGKKNGVRCLSEMEVLNLLSLEIEEREYLGPHERGEETPYSIERHIEVCFTAGSEESWTNRELANEVADSFSFPIGEFKFLRGKERDDSLGSSYGDERDGFRYTMVFEQTDVAFSRVQRNSDEYDEESEECPDCGQLVKTEEDLREHCLDDHGYWDESYGGVFDA